MHFDAQATDPCRQVSEYPRGVEVVFVLPQIGRRLERAVVHHTLGDPVQHVLGQLAWSPVYETLRGGGG